ERGRGEEEEEEGGGGGGEGHLERAAHAEHERERPIAAAAVLLELVELRERVECGEQRAESEDGKECPRLEWPAGQGPGGQRREGAEAPHVDEPVGAGHGLETERRHGVKDREDEAGRVADREDRWQQQCDP